MNITGVTGLTAPQKSALCALGAVSEDLLPSEAGPVTKRVDEPDGLLDLW